MHAHTCIHTYTYTCIHRPTYSIHTHTYIHTYIHTYTYIRKIPLTSASYTWRKFSKFYWSLSGVGIPMEQPALRRTLMVCSHQIKTTTRQRQDKCWTCAFLWCLSHQVCRTCHGVKGFIFMECTGSTFVFLLSCRCLALVWKHQI